MDATKALDIALVAYSPLARGVLADGVDDPATFAEKDIRRSMPRFSPENWPAHQKLAAAFSVMAKDQGVTAAQLCLAWVLSRSANMHVIPGTAKIAHMKENIARWDWDIPPAVAHEIDALINNNTVTGHRYPEAVRPTIDTEEF